MYLYRMLIYLYTLVREFS